MERGIDSMNMWRPSCRGQHPEGPPGRVRVCAQQQLHLARRWTGGCQAGSEGHYADNLTRSSSRGTSDGAAWLHAPGGSHEVQRFNCRTYDYYRNECPQNNDEKERGHSGGKPHWKKNGVDAGINGEKGSRDGSAGTALEEGTPAAIQLAVDASVELNAPPTNTTLAPATKHVSS